MSKQIEIIKVRDIPIKDLGNSAEAKRLIDYLTEVSFSNSLILDLRGCYIDYPATPQVIDSVFRRFESYTGDKKLTLALRPTIWNLDSLSGIFAKESPILAVFDNETRQDGDQKRSTRKLLADYCARHNITFEIYVIDSKDANIELMTILKSRIADIFLNLNP